MMMDKVTPTYMKNIAPLRLAIIATAGAGPPPGPPAGPVKFGITSAKRSAKITTDSRVGRKMIGAV